MRGKTCILLIMTFDREQNKSIQTFEFLMS